MSSQSVPASSRSFAALRHPGYRAYFITSALAMMADSIEHVISYWIVFEKFHSSALGGVAILTHWLPFLLFSVYAGALADRFDLRRLVQAGMALFMLVSLGWGLLFMTDSLQTWHAVVLLSLHGIAGVIWTPAAQLLIHDIVGHDELQSAVRLSSSIRYLGMLLGPAVGGGLMLVLSPAWAIIVNVLIYLPLVIWCARVSYGRHGAGGAAQNKTPFTPQLGTGFWRKLQAGVRNLLDLTRQIAHQHTIVSMTLLAGAASLFIGNAYQAQMPEYAHDLGHLDTQSYSLLMAADAVGALIGAVVLESRGLLRASPRTAMSLALLWCLAIGGFALAGNYWLALSLLAMAGFLNLAFSAMAQTLVQLHAPEHLRGRVVGLFSMSSLGLRAFSGVTVGVLGAWIGIHWSLALSALSLMAATLVLLSYALRHHQGAQA